ncbi:hypothetical protein O7628_00495 [Micromonospora sp. WMMD956]|uniref:hypothetical protein n=1 Tax=Micromonospora sp. WMMD956 TaxID=3016108 RepID=UPI002416BB60|nr:hypothetical protein [Micromonospora sp. WMMD956]MDG4813986.1 hypothetical protein [Micromonospora sp. WMMD956]
MARRRRARPWPAAHQRSAAARRRRGFGFVRGDLVVVGVGLVVRGGLVVAVPGAWTTVVR